MAAPLGFQINVTKSGRIRGPNLSDPQLKAIGEKMVADQKARWASATNASGQPAQKLSVRYAIIKQAVLHKRAKRDMSMTGKTIANFTLRKAANDTIRAENTTRLERQKAMRANGYDQMIGFTVQEVYQIAADSQTQFGRYVETAWIPLGGSSGNRRGPAVTPQSTYGGPPSP
jgi:hypothetical protein